jgi:hypothetical protein
MITLNNNFEYNFDLVLYNSLGKIVIQKSLSGKQQILDLKSLPKGIYLISFTSNKEKIFRKIIKE